MESQQNKIHSLICNLERKLDNYSFFEINSEILDYISELKREKFDKNKYEEWYNKLTKYIIQYDKNIKLYEEQKKQLIQKIMQLIKRNSTISKEIVREIKSNKNLSIDEYKTIINKIINKQNKTMTVKTLNSSSSNTIIKSPYILLLLLDDIILELTNQKVSIKLQLQLQQLLFQQ